MKKKTRRKLSIKKVPVVVCIACSSILVTSVVIIKSNFGTLSKTESASDTTKKYEVTKEKVLIDNQEMTKEENSESEDKVENNKVIESSNDKEVSKKENKVDTPKEEVKEETPKTKESKPEVSEEESTKENDKVDTAEEETKEEEKTEENEPQVSEEKSSNENETVDTTEEDKEVENTDSNVTDEKEEIPSEEVTEPEISEPETDNKEEKVEEPTEEEKENEEITVPEEKTEEETKSETNTEVTEDNTFGGTDEELVCPPTVEESEPEVSEEESSNENETVDTTEEEKEVESTNSNVTDEKVETPSEEVKEPEVSEPETDDKEEKVEEPKEVEDTNSNVTEEKVETPSEEVTEPEVSEPEIDNKEEKGEEPKEVEDTNSNVTEEKVETPSEEVTEPEVTIPETDNEVTEDNTFNETDEDLVCPPKADEQTEQESEQPNDEVNSVPQFGGNVSSGPEIFEESYGSGSSNVLDTEESSKQESKVETKSQEDMKKEILAALEKSTKSNSAHFIRTIEGRYSVNAEIKYNREQNRQFYKNGKGSTYVEQYMEGTGPYPSYQNVWGRYSETGNWQKEHGLKATFGIYEFNFLDGTDIINIVESDFPYVRYTTYDITISGQSANEVAKSLFGANADLCDEDAAKCDIISKDIVVTVAINHDGYINLIETKWSGDEVTDSKYEMEQKVYILGYNVSVDRPSGIDEAEKSDKNDSKVDESTNDEENVSQATPEEDVTPEENTEEETKPEVTESKVDAEQEEQDEEAPSVTTPEENTEEETQPKTEDQVTGDNTLNEKNDDLVCPPQADEKTEDEVNSVPQNGGNITSGPEIFDESYGSGNSNSLGTEESSKQESKVETKSQEDMKNEILDALKKSTATNSAHFIRTIGGRYHVDAEIKYSKEQNRQLYKSRNENPHVEEYIEGEEGKYPSVQNVWKLNNDTGNWEQKHKVKAGFGIYEFNFLNGTDIKNIKESNFPYVRYTTYDITISAQDANKVAKSLFGANADLCDKDATKCDIISKDIVVTVAINNEGYINFIETKWNKDSVTDPSYQMEQKVYILGYGIGVDRPKGIDETEKSDKNNSKVDEPTNDEDSVSQAAPEEDVTPEDDNDEVKEPEVTTPEENTDDNETDDNANNEPQVEGNMPSDPQIFDESYGSKEEVNEPQTQESEVEKSTSEKQDYAKLLKDAANKTLDANSLSFTSKDFLSNMYIKYNKDENRRWFFGNGYEIYLEGQKGNYNGEHFVSSSFNQKWWSRGIREFGWKEEGSLHAIFGVSHILFVTGVDNYQNITVSGTSKDITYYTVTISATDANKVAEEVFNNKDLFTSNINYKVGVNSEGYLVSITASWNKNVQKYSNNTLTLEVNIWDIDKTSIERPKGINVSDDQKDSVEDKQQSEETPSVDEKEIGSDEEVQNDEVTAPEEIEPETKEETTPKVEESEKQSTDESTNDEPQIGGNVSSDPQIFDESYGSGNSNSLDTKESNTKESKVDTKSEEDMKKEVLDALEKSSETNSAYYKRHISGRYHVDAYIKYSKDQNRQFYKSGDESPYVEEYIEGVEGKYPSVQNVWKLNNETGHWEQKHKVKAGFGIYEFSLIVKDGITNIKKSKLPYIRYTTYDLTISKDAANKVAKSLFGARADLCDSDETKCDIINKDIIVTVAINNEGYINFIETKWNKDSVTDPSYQMEQKVYILEYGIGVDRPYGIDESGNSSKKESTQSSEQSNSAADESSSEDETTPKEEEVTPNNSNGVESSPEIFEESYTPTNDLKESSKQEEAKETETTNYETAVADAANKTLNARSLTYYLNDSLTGYLYVMYNKDENKKLVYDGKGGWDYFEGLEGKYRDHIEGRLKSSDYHDWWHSTIRTPWTKEGRLYSSFGPSYYLPFLSDSSKLTVTSSGSSTYTVTVDLQFANETADKFFTVPEGTTFFNNAPSFTVELDSDGYIKHVSASWNKDVQNYNKSGKFDVELKFYHVEDTTINRPSGIKVDEKDTTDEKDSTQSNEESNNTKVDEVVSEDENTPKEEEVTPNNSNEVESSPEIVEDSYTTTKEVKESSKQQEETKEVETTNYSKTVADAVNKTLEARNLTYYSDDTLSGYLYVMYDKDQNKKFVYDGKGGWDYFEGLEGKYRDNIKGRLQSSDYHDWWHSTIRTPWKKEGSLYSSFGASYYLPFLSDSSKLTVKSTGSSTYEVTVDLTFANETADRFFTVIEGTKFFNQAPMFTVELDSDGYVKKVSASWNRHVQSYNKGSNFDLKVEFYNIGKTKISRPKGVTPREDKTQSNS